MSVTRAAWLYEAWQAAREACPKGMTLRLDCDPDTSTPASCGASYEAHGEYGRYVAFSAYGATEEEALTRLVASVRGEQEVAA